MTRFRAFPKILAVLGIALGLGVVASLLPENPYQRWQLLQATNQRHARWIYERSVFDPTPVDVVFVGSSRIVEGVDAPRIGAALQARGLPSNVVNFALPDEGRNLNYVVVRQLLERKHPKLLVVGVEELPYHFGHPAFKYLADRDLVVDPQIWSPSYFEDLIYLPYRQMHLFAAMTVPGGMGLAKTFDPQGYEGHSLETAGRRTEDDGSERIRQRPGMPSEQTRCLKAYLAKQHGRLLPARLSDLEYGVERQSIRLIAEMAQRNGVQVAFLAVPYYTGPISVEGEAYYQRYGPVWRAGFLASHGELYADCGHLAVPGAQRLTDWLTEPVAQALRSHPPT